MKNIFKLIKQFYRRNGIWFNEKSQTPALLEKELEEVEEGTIIAVFEPFSNEVEEQTHALLQELVEWSERMLNKEPVKNLHMKKILKDAKKVLSREEEENDE